MRGLGLLALIVPGAICGLSVVIATTLTSNAGASPSLSQGIVGAAILVAGLGSAYLIWRWGNALNADPGRTLIDPNTGRAVILRTTHSLFSIPMQWWAIPVGAVAAIFGAALLLAAATMH